jgi:mRNA-degrading endonuclease toxin of MazEF toxin-antitoxin module
MVHAAEIIILRRFLCNWSFRIALEGAKRVMGISGMVLGGVYGIIFYMIKRFSEWLGLKEKLHENGEQAPFFSENEIWWCSIGENVGVEINGKSDLFSRPVFIYRKLSRTGFMGVPMTTQIKDGSWYVNVDFRGKRQVANLAQSRVLGVERLSNRMGVLDDKDAGKIRKAFCELYQ